MSKHPIDHDRQRNDGKVAEAYAKIDRQQAGGAADPKVQTMTKAARASESTLEAAGTRLKKFVKIDREHTDL